MRQDIGAELKIAIWVSHTKRSTQALGFWCILPPSSVLALFVDASFAGDLRDSKSTSGAFMFLVGPNTFVPLKMRIWA